MPLMLVILLVGASAAQVPTMTPLPETTKSHSLPPNADSAVNTSLYKSAPITSAQPTTDALRNTTARSQIDPINTAPPTGTSPHTSSHSARPADVSTNISDTAQGGVTTPMSLLLTSLQLPAETQEPMSSEKLPERSSQASPPSPSLASQSKLVLHSTAPSELGTGPVRTGQPHSMKTTVGFFNDAPVSHVEVPSTAPTMSSTSLSPPPSHPLSQKPAFNESSPVPNTSPSHSVSQKSAFNESSPVPNTSTTTPSHSVSQKSAFNESSPVPNTSPSHSVSQESAFNESSPVPNTSTTPSHSVSQKSVFTGSSPVPNTSTTTPSHSVSQKSAFNESSPVPNTSPSHSVSQKSAFTVSSRVPNTSTGTPLLRPTSTSKPFSREKNNAVVPSATSFSILRARFTSAKPRMTTSPAPRLTPFQLKGVNQTLVSTTMPTQVEQEVEMDNSTDNCTNEYCVSDDDYLDMMLKYMFPTTYEWVLIAMHSVVFVVGIVGNALVCVAVYRNHSMRTVTNYFIVNLAVADFLVILLCLPPTVLWDVTETWFMGTALCKIVLYFQTVSVAVSVLTLTFISLDRWYAICFPLKFKSTTGRAKTAIVVIWVLALTFDIPELIVLQTKRKELRVDTPFFTQCQPSWSVKADVTFHSVKTLLLYSVPLVFMTIAYFQIVRVLWSRSNIPGHMETLKESHSNGDTNSSRKIMSRHMSVNMTTHGQVLCRRKAAKMLVAVVIMFAVCYFPVHLLSILRFSMDIPQTDATTAFSMVSHWLCYANSAVNPLIYNFMSGKFRLEFRRAFQQCACAWLVVCGPGASVDPIERVNGAALLKKHAHVDSHTTPHAHAVPNVNSHAHAHLHVHHVKESRTLSPLGQTRQHSGRRPLHLTQLTGSTRFSPDDSLLDESRL